MNETMLNDHVTMLKLLYERFNARDIDGVLGQLTHNVMWANGMEGGYVHGHNALRNYWERQWALVSPHVAPMSWHRIADDAVAVTVQQTVRDLQGRPLVAQAHDLHDKLVRHVFTFDKEKVARFDIEAAD